MQALASTPVTACLSPTQQLRSARLCLRELPSHSHTQREIEGSLGCTTLRLACVSHWRVLGIYNLSVPSPDEVEHPGPAMGWDGIMSQ